MNGFDNKKYLQLQTKKIKERVQEFGGKLYLEFGGKLFDDYHASRVLPGFKPDSKVAVLHAIKEQVEVVIVINAEDIAQNKLRGDLGITYHEDVLRLYDLLTSRGLLVSSVVIAQFSSDNAPAVKFQRKLENLGLKVYRHYHIEGYPANISKVVSDEGFGKNDYIETSRKVVVVTAPGPGSGKMATCLSQLYHDAKRGLKSGYAKYETFPIWNLPLTHPVNIAYESATADLDDLNMIDPYHMQAYGVSTVNYNRDVEVFPVLNALFTKLLGQSPYKSPTDMGVNMAGYCISNDEVCCQASKQEVIRRYFSAKVQVRVGVSPQSMVEKLDLIMSKLGISESDRAVVNSARAYKKFAGKSVAALQLKTGKIVTGKASCLMDCIAAVFLNSLKTLGRIPDIPLIEPSAIQPIQNLKTSMLGEVSSELNAEEALIALSVSASINSLARRAFEQLPKLRGCQMHTTTIPSAVDEKICHKLGIQLTSDDSYPTTRVYFK